MVTDEAQNNLLTGARYFFRGIKLLLHPQLRKYILVPLLVNCVLFISLTYFLIGYFDNLSQWDLNLPAWLELAEKVLKWAAWFLIVVVVLIGYGYLFNIITNILAAPFYGLLAQKTEELLLGVGPPDESLLKMIPRTTIRELQKLLYFLVRGLMVLLLMLVLGTLLVLSFLVPVIGTLWGAWCMAIQYVDYPADNHQTPFRSLRKRLRSRKYSSIGFGTMVMGCSMIPVLNIIAMPAAVTGGTLFWIHELRPSTAPQQKSPTPL